MCKSIKAKQSSKLLQELAHAAFDTLIAMGKTSEQIIEMIADEKTADQIVKLSFAGLALAMLQQQEEPAASR